MPDTMQPFAHRPLKSLLRAVAQQLDDDAYLSMSRSEFIGAVMKSSGGAVNPKIVGEFYDDLMADAGMPQPDPAPYRAFLSTALKKRADELTSSIMAATTDIRRD